jgi:sialidase-1
MMAGRGKGTRTCWVTSSADDGVTWAVPREITSTVKKPDWTWCATGPGVGTQLRHGPHQGRLIVPCDHYQRGKTGSYSHVIWSDDHGKTWELGGRIPGGIGNECQLVELTNGDLIMNMRAFRDRKTRDRPYLERTVSISSDGGAIWSDPVPIAALPEPACQASLIRCFPSNDADRPWLLFSNPADRQERQRMTVRLSKDDGKSWPFSKEIEPEQAAYSCLAMLPDGRVACLYERDDYKQVALTVFSLEWLENE